MKKLIVLIALALVLVVTAVACGGDDNTAETNAATNATTDAVTEAGTAVEGTVAEGTAVEGTAVEGTAVEGTAVEGTAVEGTVVEGTEVAGTDAATTQEPATEDPATEAPATEDPATEAPATEAPATEAPETEAPEGAKVPVSFDDVTVSGHKPGITPATDPTHGAMVAAAGLEEAILLHKGAIHLGELDLSKYQAITIVYSGDAGEGSVNEYYSRENNRICVTNDDVYNTASPAEESILTSATFELPYASWALTEITIDLSEVDYNGDVFISADFLTGWFLLVESIVLVEYPVA